MKISNFIDLYIPDNKFSLFQNFLLNGLINFTKSAEFDTKPENLTTKSRNIKHFIFFNLQSDIYNLIFTMPFEAI